MKKLNKTVVSSIIFFLVGIVFLMLESEFYQYIDSEGVLRESLFLPLGMLSIFISLILFLIFIIKKAWGSFRAK